MNSKQRIAELEEKLAKALRKIDILTPDSTLIKISGVPQKIVFSGNLDKGKSVHEKGARNNHRWVSAIRIIEVVER